MNNKIIENISIVSKHLSGIFPVSSPYTLICSTSPLLRLKLIVGLEYVLCGRPMEDIEPSIECFEISYVDGSSHWFVNNQSSQHYLIRRSAFKEKIVGNGYTMDRIQGLISNRRNSKEIKRMTGLRLFERRGILLIQMQRKKIIVDTLPSCDFEFIKLQIRLWELRKGYVPFLIITGETLAHLRDEARFKVFMDISSLPRNSQVIILGDPICTVGYPWNGTTSCPYIVNLDENLNFNERNK